MQEPAYWEDRGVNIDGYVPGERGSEGDRDSVRYEWLRQLKHSEAANPGWPSLVPVSVQDKAGTGWQVRRAWPDKRPGDYVLEVFAPGQPGVRGARLHSGKFRLIPLEDPTLPALWAAAQLGDVISYRPYHAVVRAKGCYIKVFRPGHAVAPAQRCAQVDILLDPVNFTTPRILAGTSPDVIVFSVIPGRTLAELGRAEATVGSELFATAWERWSRAWVAQLTGCRGTARECVLESLPVHSAEVEAVDLWRRVNRWLRHNEKLPEASPAGDALRAAAGVVTNDLLREPPDPLVWAHGDLHDRQVIIADTGTPPGLLDFSSTSRAEAALDLADLDVHLELHLRQNELDPARFLTAHAQVLAAAEELHVSPARFRAYLDAIWLRLGTSPLPGRLPLALGVLAERAGTRTTNRLGLRPWSLESREHARGRLPNSLSPLLLPVVPEWSEVLMRFLQVGC